jgi:uncharacterized membrane protein HdeD (DUF308 family)
MTNTEVDVTITKRNALAVESIIVAVAGVLAFLFASVFSYIYVALLGGVLGVVAVILAHVAFRKMRVSNATGKTFALSGLIVGYVEIFFTLLLIVLTFLFNNTGLTL